MQISVSTQSKGPFRLASDLPARGALPGRLRLAATEPMEAETAAALAGALIETEGVTQVISSAITGSVIVYYKQGMREHVLASAQAAYAEAKRAPQPQSLPKPMKRPSGPFGHLAKQALPAWLSISLEIYEAHRSARTFEATRP